MPRKPTASQQSPHVGTTVAPTNHAVLYTSQLLRLAAMKVDPIDAGLAFELRMRARRVESATSHDGDPNDAFNAGRRSMYHYLEEP